MDRNHEGRHFLIHPIFQWIRHYYLQRFLANINIVENSARMVIRWRTHEKILVSLLALYVLSIYISRVYNIPGTVKHDLYASPFLQQGKPFSYFQHILLPQVIILLVQYACYWWLTSTLIRFFRSGEKHLAKIVTVCIHLVMIALVLGPVSNFLYYLLSPHSAHAGILISPVRLTPYHLPGPFTSFVRASILVVFFSVYVLAREQLIFRLERPGPKSNYRITVINRLTAFLLFYLCLFPFVHYLAGPPSPGESMNALTSLYGIILPSLTLFGATTLYWLYPVKFATAGLNVKGTISLIVLAAICSLPSTLMEEDWEYSAFVITWIIQLLLVAPLTWMIYLQQRDRLLELMGIKNELTRSKTELTKSKTDLVLLRAHINPHFLFNALNTLYGTALAEKASGTSRGIQLLGNMMRFMLHDTQSENISLQKEIDYLKNFIALQRLRIPERAGINIQEELIEEGVEHIMIEPMILIPFVENAFKHGISLVSPSWIYIKLMLQSGDLYFNVINSFHDRKQDTARSGFGQSNVRERLEWKYPGKHELTIHQTDKEFEIILKIFQV